MEHVQHSFRRYEKKFILTEKQQKAVEDSLQKKMQADKYGVHTICNIYYDTDDFRLIRASVEQPAYKEKFRVRSYGVPDDNSMLYAEIKKKFDGIVYKRRVEASPGRINSFLNEGVPLDTHFQIQREIQWFMQYYRPVPKVFIGYERIAYLGNESEPDLRVTFDRNIRWRTDRLDLREGCGGEPVSPGGPIVMEIKTPDAIPLWLAELLSSCGVFPASFSKYGTCYLNHLLYSPEKDKTPENTYQEIKILSGGTVNA